MEIGKICKGTAVTFFILLFFAALILGNDLAAFIYYLLSGFIFCLVLYALGEIVTQLECINENTYEAYRLLDKMKSQEEKKAEKPAVRPPAPAVKRNSNGKWICKKCGTKNESNAPFCKDCGEYK